MASKHGGKRPGAGRPPSTGSASVPPVFYRVSEDQRSELDKEGERRGLTGNQVAKLRAFPVERPRPTRRAGR